MSYGTCLICRCTDNNACVHPDEGSCYWVDDTHELCSACLDHKIQPITDILIQILNVRKKQRLYNEKRKLTEGRNYITADLIFWKWISTSDIALKLKTSNRKLINLLNKMEKLGFVASKRNSNWIQWAPVVMTGCKVWEGNYFIIDDVQIIEQHPCPYNSIVACNLDYDCDLCEIISQDKQYQKEDQK